MKKQFLLLTLLLASLAVQAQLVPPAMYIQAKDGSSAGNYFLEDIRSITFSEGNMVVTVRENAYPINSGTESYALANINGIYFDYKTYGVSQKEVKDYIAAYDETISEFLNPKKETIVDSVTVEEKKSKALTKLVEYVLSQANHIEDSDDPKAILDYANKIGIFDVGEKVEELPRRYLPVSCSGCEYRKFVEENCEKEEDGTEFEANE